MDSCSYYFVTITSDRTRRQRLRDRIIIIKVEHCDVQMCTFLPTKQWRSVAFELDNYLFHISHNSVSKLKIMSTVFFQNLIYMEFTAKVLPAFIRPHITCALLLCQYLI